MRASYIDHSEVAQIRDCTIEVWNEVILKKEIFVPTSICFSALLNAHVHFSFSPRIEPNLVPGLQVPNRVAGIAIFCL